MEVTIYKNWLKKRIEQLKSEVDNADKYEIKISKGGKYAAFKEMYGYLQNIRKTNDYKLSEADKQAFDLGAVVGQSEQLKCDCCEGTGLVEGEHYDAAPDLLECLIDAVRRQGFTNENLIKSREIINKALGK